MAKAWLESLKAAEKTCLVQDGRKKVHYKFPKQHEMAEEYDLKTNLLLVRKWRKKNTLGALGKWEVEVGEPDVFKNLDLEGGIVESSVNPIFFRKDTKTTFQWRIRNLPYSLEVYNVSADSEKKCIIVRTTNKKYYKTIYIPDLERIGLKIDEAKIKIAHSNNTLIITYDKPSEVLEMEKQVQKQLSKIQASKDGDVQCNPS